jgi:acetyl-CoA acetyltransferase
MIRNSYSTGVAIVGIGESDIGKCLGRSSHSLYAQAINEAIRDAGLDKSQIDGLVTVDTNADPRTRHAMSVAQYVGLQSDSMQWIQTSKHGSVASSGGILREAMMAIRSGVCNYVVVSGAENEGTAGRDSALTKKAERRDREFEAPFGTLVVATFAMIARKYMSDYAATEEDLAEVSVAARAWANLNPKAQMSHVQITKQDVLTSPMIASPLRRLNCSLVSDGGTAMVLTSLDRAREYGDRAITLLASEVVYGRGQGIVTDDLGQLESLYSIREGSSLAVKRALDRAGMRPEEFDVYFCYDPFSFMPWLYMEALGICGEGEGAAFVRGGRLAPGGVVPLNTHGGMLSYCHPGPPGGTFHFIEAVRQLRGDAGARQIPQARTAIMQGYGANKGAFPASILLRGMP